MITIYKYTLTVGEENKFETARIVRVIHVAPGRDEFTGLIDKINVWCEVDTNAREVATFSIVGTGHPAPVNLRHYGTAVMPSGLVWHVYGDPYWSWGA